MSPLFIFLGCVYFVLCFGIITIIIMQKKRSAGLGNLSGMGMTQSYWDKNKGNSLDGKLEKFTKIGAAVYIIFTVAMCFIK